MSLRRCLTAPTPSRTSSAPPSGPAGSAPPLGPAGAGRERLAARPGRSRYWPAGVAGTAERGALRRRGPPARRRARPRESAARRPRPSRGRSTRSRPWSRRSDPSEHALEAFAQVVEESRLGRQDRADRLCPHPPAARRRPLRPDARIRYWNTGSWILSPTSARAAYARYLRYAWPGTAVLIDERRAQATTPRDASPTSTRSFLPRRAGCSLFQTASAVSSGARPHRGGEGNSRDQDPHQRRIQRPRARRCSAQLGRGRAGESGPLRRLRRPHPSDRRILAGRQELPDRAPLLRPREGGEVRSRFIRLARLPESLGKRLRVWGCRAATRKPST